MRRSRSITAGDDVVVIPAKHGVVAKARQNRIVALKTAHDIIVAADLVVGAVDQVALGICCIAAVNRVIAAGAFNDEVAWICITEIVVRGHRRCARAAG